VHAATTTSADDVVAQLGTDAKRGLSTDEAARRLAEHGPNAVRDHRARALGILARQLRSPLLILLFATAALSYGLGERTNALIIGLILVGSIGLGFVNEYRAERASHALHSGIRHLTLVIRDGQPRQVDVVELVPGDVVHLSVGCVVPADIRLFETTALECDESVLTGESMPSAKTTAPSSAGGTLADAACIAWMGTVVHDGSGAGIVVATGADTEFGGIAAGLGEREQETEFQVGLRKFSGLLLQVALVLTLLILTTNLLLQRPFLDSVLFSLAIAVGITPQLLPAVVSTSLAAGSRQLARRKVLVKRLVCIEDLGDLDVLVTDKTGTLTEGAIGFEAARAPDGSTSMEPMVLGLLASDVESTSGHAVGGNPLDVALWEAAAEATTSGYKRLGSLPFDYQRQRASVIVTSPDGRRLLVVKGAPESVLAACPAAGPEAAQTLDDLYAKGSRVIAVASRVVDADVRQPTAADERDLELAGFLVFRDPPKPSAAQSLQRLRKLGITVKVATGDSAAVARRLCADLGFDVSTVLTGPDIEALGEEGLIQASFACDVFARVSPEQKARIVEALRHGGRAVGFLGDGVNDALALHKADVGISVDTGTDVAKDAADVVLLEKSLDVLADGVAEGRRIFANTIKYVLMGTSSNFGNMFSAAAASAVLPFLPMLPSQILLNNLLYDVGQLTIPSDNVDEEQLLAPSHWDIHFIRRFMLFFGPLSSLFDFLTFGIMLGPLHAGADLFRSGWFVESMATQTLVIFAIRTRRIPFIRSRASRPLTAASFAVVLVAAALPLSPLSGVLGFASPPLTFYLALVVMVVGYLVLVELGKRIFFAGEQHLPRPVTPRVRNHRTRVNRRAARFSLR
jgi:Mg2+-importing ATPase